MRIYRQTCTKNGQTITVRKFYADVRLNHRRFRLPLYESPKLSNDFAANLESLIGQFSGKPGNYDKNSQQWINGLTPDMLEHLVKMGLIDSARLIEKTPIQDHIDGYIEYLKHKQDTEIYCEQCKTRIQNIIDGCGFLSLADIQSGKILKFVSGELTAGKIKMATYNHFLRAIKGFLRWLYNEDRIHTDLSKYLKLIAVTDSEVRRPLTLDEITYLLDWLVTKAQTARGLTGWERALLYRFAMTTGLRADEIRSLTVSSIDFDSLTVYVKSASTKNKKKAEQPIRPDLLEDLRLLVKGKLPGDSLFKRVTDKTAVMLRKDMTDARAVYLTDKYPDEAERQKAEKDDYFLVSETDEGKLQFHGLRSTFGTLMAANGVNPKTAQVLMRHSSISLTMDLYSHIYRGAETTAVNGLPSFDKPQQNQDLKKA